mgnify:FL=1
MGGSEDMKHGGDIYRNPVKLDFSVNINPLGIPERVQKALIQAVSECMHYPDMEAEALIQAVGRMTGVPAEYIVCGNGASELFVAVMHALSPKKILIPVPSFLGYEKAAATSGAEVRYYHMSEENGFSPDDAIFKELADGVDFLFLANPNNPTGSRVKPELLERIIAFCRDSGITVVLDECFIEFTDGWEARTFFKRTGEFKNLIVVRAFTKIFAIPGVRLGYLVCENKAVRERIKDQLPEWNLSVFAQRAGVAAAGEEDYRRKTVTFLNEERSYLVTQLEKLGIRVFPGAADFLLLYSELPLYGKLLKQGILIRDCSNFRGLKVGYYRIAVKTRGENDRLIAALAGICADKKER